MYDHPLSILNPFLFILLICAYMRVVSFLKCLCTSFLATTSQIYEQFNITAPFLVRTHFTCTTLCARRVLHGVEPSIFDIAPCHSTTPTFTASGPVCVCVQYTSSAHIENCVQVSSMQLFEKKQLLIIYRLLQSPHNQSKSMYTYIFFSICLVMNTYIFAINMCEFSCSSILGGGVSTIPLFGITSSASNANIFPIITFILQKINIILSR